MNPDDPLEQLKALRAQQNSGSDDPLAQLKALKGNSRVPHDVPGNIDLRQPADSTRVTPTPKPPAAPDGAGLGVFDSGMDMLTLGAHSKVRGMIDAAGDVLTHGLNSHPSDTYDKSLAATDARVKAAGSAYPTAKTAADATGFFGSIAAEAPLRAILGLPEVVSTATRGQKALARITAAAKESAAHGAQYGALAGAIGGRPKDASQAIEQTGEGALVGSVLGRTFGGLGASVGEGVRGVQRFLGPITAPLEERATALANKLFQPAINTAAVPRRATQALQTGNTGAILAHLGDQGLDQLTYLASSGASPEADLLRTRLTQAQRGEGNVLQEGVTAMSGRDQDPKNSAVNFLKDLEAQRQARGRQDYPRALAAPPIQDASILQDIAADPDLAKGFTKGIQLSQKEANLAAMEGRGPRRTINNPLDAFRPQAQPLSGSIDALYRDDPVMAEIAKAQLAKSGASSPAPQAVPGIPMDVLNNFKQGVDATVEKGLDGRPLDRKGAGLTNSALQSILQRADAQAPEFAATRARQVPFYNRSEGGQAGHDALSQTGPEILSQMADLSKPGQQEAYRTVMTSDLRDKIKAKGYDQNVGKSLFDNPRAEEQLDAGYGAGARDRFQPYLDQAATVNRVAGASATAGSQTAYRTKINENLGDAGTNDAIHAILHPKRALYQIPSKIADRASKSAQQEALRISAERLATPASDPNLQDILDAINAPAPVYGGAPLQESPRGWKAGVLSNLILRGNR